MNACPVMEDVFWNRLFLASEAISETRTGEPDQALESLIALLAGLEEGFYDRFDPADSFQAYAAVSFCRAVRRCLSNGQR